MGQRISNGLSLLQHTLGLTWVLVEGILAAHHHPPTTQTRLSPPFLWLTAYVRTTALALAWIAAKGLPF